MKITALDRKLLRDLLGMKGQALAIGMVLAAGIAMYVAYLSNFDSLRRTQDAYYDRFRFADVFAFCKRAPLRLEERLREIPGVAVADTRVVVDVTLDLPGVTEPIKGRLISVPPDRRPLLNDLYVRRGRWIEPGKGDEVLLNEAFALAHHLAPGDRFAALINGRRQVLRVAGHALSPEYVYVLPPGEVIPDDKRFGVVWMERRALASAFEMEGAFDDVALKLIPGASEAEVIAQVDRLLRPWGGLGAVPRRLQTSHWALDNELAQLQSFGFLVPAIFLGVAAFLINVAMARTLAVQRPQIAALKALGYSNAAIGWHYVKWGLAIAALGALLGMGAGSWLGSAMIGLYNQYFRFPILLYRLSGGVVMTALAIGLGSAAMGAAFAVRRAVRIPPAEAMRPEPPARYHTSFVERPAFQRHLTHATRMVLRNLERQPWRALASIIGIAFAVAILFFGFIFIDVMDRLAEVQFTEVQRQDLTVSFVEPRSSGALYELRALPGVMAIEPVRTVPARLRFGHRSRQLAITGQGANPDLNRVVDLSGKVVALPPSGLVLSKILGEILGVKSGDRITVEVLEGARPVREVEVAALVDDYMGLAAFMEKGALDRLMREGASLSGAHLMVDAARTEALYRRLKATPAVAGIALTAAARASFDKIMAENFTLITSFNVAFAVIIAFGVVYNAARISLSERSRELASLRVLGFTIGEISLILLGELALLTLAAIPPGLVIGWALAKILLMAFQNEFYRLPLLITPQNAAWSSLTVILAAALSGLAVRRKLDHLDLVAVLKALAFWPAAIPVDVAPVTRGTLRVTVDEEGETRVRHRFVVSAPVAGQVLRIELEPGEPVHRGQTALATFMPAPSVPLDERSRAEAEASAAAARANLGGARAERQRARAALTLAESERERHRELARQKIVSSQALEARETEALASAEALRAAEFAVASAEQQLEMARARLVQADGGSPTGRAITLRSPIDGVVFKRLRESEAVVAAGAPLLEIGDPRGLEVVSDLLSSDAVKVTPGAAVLLEQWGGDHPIQARVRRVEPSGFMKISALGVEEQRVNVVMDLEDPLETWSALGDGYRVEVRIVIWEGDGVLKVPTSSLFRRGEDWALFAANGGRATLAKVEVGHRNGAEAQILAGLREADRVVLHPSESLRDGSRVRPRAP